MLYSLRAKRTHSRFCVFCFSRAHAKSLNTTAFYNSVKKMAESGEKGKEEKGVTHVAGENATIFEGIKKIFERAEHSRHREHAEEFLDKLVREKIQPLEGDGFLQYDETYDDFVLMLEWWDYDPDGLYSWQGTLEYFLKYYYKNGKYYSDDELAAQIDEILADLLRKEKEREEWGKEVARRLEESEVEKNE